MNKYNGLSEYRIRKIIECISTDIDATKTSLLLKLNRKTISHYYNLFRQCIYHHQLKEKEAFTGHLEVDESYFGATHSRGNTSSAKRGSETNKQCVLAFLKEMVGFTQNSLIMLPQLFCMELLRQSRFE